MIDDWLCEGYWFSHERKPAEAVAAWSKVWAALRPRLTADMKHLDEAGERLFPGMSQCLFNWGTDLRLEAAHASFRDTESGGFGIRFIRELLEALPGENEDLNWQGDLAM